MRKLSIILAYIGIVVVLIVLTTATYAYVVYEPTEENIGDARVQLLQVQYTDTSNIALVNARAGDEIVKYFYITNVSGKDLYYDINLVDVANSFVNPRDLVYTLTSDDGAISSSKVVPSQNSTIASGIKINIGETHKYVLDIDFLKTDKNQFENEMKTFFAELNVTIFNNDKIYEYADNSLYKLMESRVIGSEENINFLTNENEGVFYTNSTINGSTIYFYRGSNLLNNNLILGDKCYKIIRTTESLDVKVIYNGESVDGTCSSHSVNVVERLNTYNNNSNHNAYVGYMYGNASSLDYVNEHSNINSSVIKIYLDSWYNSNLSEYKNYISNESIYCANRMTSEFTYNKVNFGNKGYANNVSGYALMDEYYNNGTISLDCENINDRYSVSSSYGNNDLTNSIGLITLEELYYAGYIKGNNTSNYLYSVYPYWTMTPAYFNKSNAYNFIVNKGNISQDKVSNDNAIRPVITLKGSVKIISGDGSETTPYLLSE